MSLTVTISGSKSELASYFQPPISLSGQYECGLLYFSVLNLKPGDAHVDNNILSVVRIECDLIHGSYSDGLPTHNIHEFLTYNTVGHQHIERPQNVIYFPVNKNIISSISIKIVDQFGHSIHFDKADIQLSLHLRKIT